MASGTRLFKFIFSNLIVSSFLFIKLVLFWHNLWKPTIRRSRNYALKQGLSVIEPSGEDVEGKFGD